MTQLFIGSKPTPGQMKPIRNDGFIKPTGGLWTSTLVDGSSGWMDWCEREDFRVPNQWRGWTLTPATHARVYLVNSEADATRLFRTYGERLHSFWLLDFEHCAQDWDAIHLTDEGEQATRHMFPTTFNGWDCESTLWFRWLFTSVKPWRQNRQPRRTSMMVDGGELVNADPLVFIP